MKILVLIGSYRKNGNTDQVTELIKTELKIAADQNGESVDVETIFLGHQQLAPCRGCRVCFDRGEEKCPLRDDLLAIKAKMKAADGLLIASPVYVDDVSGITKTWIDRLAHVCHRPEFAGKSAYLVVTVGSSPTRHALQTLHLALSTWGFHIVGQAGFKTGALMKPEVMIAQNQEKAADIARRFYQALRTRESARPSFFSLMMFKIQQLAWQKRSNNPDTVDYRYWDNQGWLSPQRDYYIAHQASALKVTLARLFGALIARFVS
jgi:multimeric flavodoxin WrbA